jgi:NAD(P)-dependent dehydrogenase (short-subunit alcohol dehydrogenase family)
MTTTPTRPVDSPAPALPHASEFAGRSVLVTGGTAGLGRHLVQTLVELEADVTFCGRSRDTGEELARAWGPSARFVQCDVADLDGVRAMVGAVEQHCGQLDFLVNNAGIDPPIPFDRTSPEDFEQIFQVNLRAMYFTTQAALPLLKAGVGKAVVNISTTNYLHGWPGMTAYNAVKGGIVGFSRSLARELGEHGIRVNVVSPGWIMTERQLREKVNDSAKQNLIRQQCVKRLLHEEDVTPVTLFLLSQASGAMSGQSLVVDGGFYMQ